MIKEIFKKTTISKESIDSVLDYVNPSERRVISAEITNRTILGIVRCFSPTYTKKTVEYISSSEVMISLAQISHIFIDELVRQPYFEFKYDLTQEKLKILRDNHEIYFTNMSLVFNDKVPQSNYELKVELIGYKKFLSLFAAKFNFNIDTKIYGSFTAGMTV
ncbi:MAG: hypothetical protein ABJ004_07715 [Cyclobacteriaceae bacterium]